MIKGHKVFFTKGIKDQLNQQYNKFKYVTKSGYGLLHDPNYNKTLAYSQYERRSLGLQGFLPDAQFTIQQQADLILKEFHHGLMEQAELYRDEETNVIGVTPDMIRKSRVLRNMQELNNTLYYNMICSNWSESLSIIQTPAIAWYIKNFSYQYRRPRGMIISLKDKGNVAALLKNSPLSKSHIFFITDGSKVLSIGDWGLNAVPIVIARKDIYVAAAGFNPWKNLPITIDVGTDNEQLLSDPYYLGLRQRRASQEELFELLDEVMQACQFRYPNGLFVFEDMCAQNAFQLLDRYKGNYKVLNEDLQGTGSIILAGILGGLKMHSKSLQSIRDLKMILVGAGNAATGIAHTLHFYLKTLGMSDL